VCRRRRWTGLEDSGCFPVFEITVSDGRRDPATGRYGQISRTVRTTPTRPGAKGIPKAVEAEAAKVLAEVEAGRHQGTRHTTS
jgi:hypothetical protein